MRVLSNYTPKQNPSFTSVGYEAISALNSEITGQKSINVDGEWYVEQQPELKYRLLSNYEEGVIKALNEKARKNEILNVGIIKNPSGNNNFINEYGDTFAILDNKGKVIKKIPNAVGNGLSPTQQINNLKFAVDLAEKLANQDGQGFIKKLFSKHFPKLENLKFYPGTDDTLYPNTVFTTDSAIINAPVEELSAPISSELDITGLELKESVLKMQNNNNIEGLGKTKTFHNVIQRNIGNIDEQQKLTDFLKKVSPELESENTFTVDMYNNLSEEKKNSLRDFCDNHYSFSYGGKKASTKIGIDLDYVEHFAQVAKENLDKKYGKGNYTIFGLGNSPSCMLSMLNLNDDVEATTIPFSRTVINESDPNLLKGTNEKVDWKNYFETFGLDASTIEKNKTQGKATVIVDYVETNTTMDVLKDIFKKINLPVKDINFEDLGDLCWSERPEDSQLNRIFGGQFFNGRKIKLYSTCQNVGDNIEFYKNIKQCTSTYKWHPFTKLFFFSMFDKLAKRL